MSKKAAKRQPGKGKPAVKVNKTAWVLSQPPSMPAKDVVAKAKAEGFTLSPAQVYTARSKAKSKGTAPVRAPRGQARAGGQDTRAAEFRKLVLLMGFDQAEAELARLKQGVGLG